MNSFVVNNWFSNLGDYINWLPEQFVLDLARGKPECEWQDPADAMRVLNALSHLRAEEFQQGLNLLEHIDDRSWWSPSSTLIRARIYLLLDEPQSVVRELKRFELVCDDPSAYLQTVEEITLDMSSRIDEPELDSEENHANDLPLAQSFEAITAPLADGLGKTSNPWLDGLGEKRNWLPENILEEIESDPRETSWSDPKATLRFINIVSFAANGDLEKSLQLVSGWDAGSNYYDDSLFLKSQILLEEQKFDLAVSTLDEAIKACDSNTKAIGFAELFKKRLEEVEKHLVRKTTLGADSRSLPQPNLDKGSCFTLNGNPRSGGDLPFMRRIPMTINVVWIGDESKRPDLLIDTWRRCHPDWIIKVWGNSELYGDRWLLWALMEPLIQALQWHGVADLMRYEILWRNGGITVDADSLCLRALDSHVLQQGCFAAYENEIQRPGLIANGTMGAVQNHPFIEQVISLAAGQKAWDPTIPIWQMYGPGLLTRAVRRFKPADLKIFPSFYFTPEHFTGEKFKGDPSLVFARQFWGTTRGISKNLQDLTVLGT